MKIRVYQGNQFIFSGEAKEFLEYNQDDSDITEAIQQLQQKGYITLETYHNGSWIIEKIPTELKILIKENSMFGGYIGRLVNSDLTSLDLPLPFNTSHTGYTGRDKERIINQCKDDARLIFDIENLEIIDTTITEIFT